MRVLWGLQRLAALAFTSFFFHRGSVRDEKAFAV